MAVGLVTDGVALPALLALRDSLAAWWAAQPNPVKVLGLRWGNDYSALIGSTGNSTVDEGCPGICWIRFVSLGEVRTGLPAVAPSASPCGPASWGVTVEIGVQRCAAQFPKPEGSLPDDDQWAAIVTQATADMAVVRKAVLCAALPVPAGGSRGVSWGTQSPLPIDGNLTGSTIQVTIPILDSDCSGC